MNPNKSNKTPSEITIASTVFSRRKSGTWRKNPPFFPGLKKAVYALVCTAFIAALLLIGNHGIPLFKQYKIVSGKLDRVITDQFHELLSAPLTLRPGMKIDALQLQKRLKACGYRLSSRDTLAAGEYAQSNGRVMVRSKLPGNSSGPVAIDCGATAIELISDMESGRVMAGLQLGPIRLTSFLDSIWEVRYPVQYAEYPPALLHAVVSAEDKNFYTHHGIDLRSILRAAWVNLVQGKVVQGGSTITQQLVKTLLQRKGRGVKDKAYEALLAVAIELRYDKKDILEAYLNTLYLGQEGPFAIHGMGAAARHLLGTAVEDLTVKQAAMLAGIIRAPNSLSPRAHPARAMFRAQTVLEQMQQNGYLKQPLLISEHPSKLIGQNENSLLPLAWYYQQLEKELADIDLYTRQKTKGYGMKIQLGLNPFMQQDAQQLLNQHLDRLESKKQLSRGQLQGAIVSINLGNGTMQTLIGGRDFQASQFNRATSARRQIGSLVKPFVYLAAMAGAKNGNTALTQASLVNDTPLKLKVGNSSWRPRNFDRRYMGQITLRQALADSRNIPAVRIGLQAGVKATGEFIKKLGINAQPATGPALFLGAVESSPVKMAAAYGALANGGYYREPGTIEQIRWQGQLLYKHPAAKAIMKSEDAYVMTDMLREVFDSGTAKSAKKYGVPPFVAGKTGTSNKLRDGWFAGYTLGLVTVVWVGLDNNRSMGLTGAASGLPVWAELMARYGGGEREEFAIPDGIEFASVLRRNGKRTLHLHNDTVQIAFVKGTMPSEKAYRQVAMIRRELHKRPFQASATPVAQRYKYFR